MENISIMVLPFVINGHGQPTNAFECKYVRDIFSNDVNRRFLDKIERLPLIKSNILDKKHHPFILDFISIMDGVSENDPNIKSGTSSLGSYPVLKIYDINLGKLNIPGKRGPVSTADENGQGSKDLSREADQGNKAFGYRRSNHILELDDYFSVDIQKIYIVHNVYSGVGYFIIEFKLSSSKTNLNYADELSSLKFFRYYRNSEIKDDRDYQLKYRRRNSIYDPNGPCFSIEDFITCQFPELMSDIQFLYIKPVMLHLLHGEILKSFTKQSQIYNTLRIITPIIESPPLALKSSQADIVRLSTGTLFCAMNEGAMVLDTSKIENNDMIMKYLPAFLISLNQREILIQLNRLLQGSDFIRTDNIGSSSLKGAARAGVDSLRGISADINYDKTGLVNLRERITIYQLKQVFYSISFYEEIDAFYRKLQAVFNVELLLEDNRQSIAEINTLVDKLDHEDAERKNRIKMEKEDIFIVLISIIQLVDLLLPDPLYNENKLFPITVKFWHLLIAMIFAFFAWRLIHSDFSGIRKISGFLKRKKNE